jgi:hypothetical protein
MYTISAIETTEVVFNKAKEKFGRYVTFNENHFQNIYKFGSCFGYVYFPILNKYYMYLIDSIFALSNEPIITLNVKHITDIPEQIKQHLKYTNLISK